MTLLKLNENLLAVKKRPGNAGEGHPPQWGTGGV